jgi:MYXO-CTERM domain-containing protein
MAGWGAPPLETGVCRVNSSAPPGTPARLAFGMLGLVLLFGLGYRISAVRYRRATPSDLPRQPGERER